VLFGASLILFTRKKSRRRMRKRRAAFDNGRTGT